jgi:UDP-N-acetylglucosamine 1-carboxyvinyltransferase
MDRIRIAGGNKLNGEIHISGAKNAALPLMIASLLTPETLTLRNLPRLADVQLLKRILHNHGVDQHTKGPPRRREGWRGRNGQLHRSRDCRHDGALSSRLADAGKLLGAGSAAGALP